jgi:hypothetical protein
MARRERRARHVARVEEERIDYRDLVGETRRKHSLEDLGVDRRIILKWALMN